MFTTLEDALFMEQQNDISFVINGKIVVLIEHQSTINKPEIIVLYNGEDEMPEQQVLKLSDMFIGFGKDEIPNLECIVKVLNINKGINEELAKRSEVLSGYEIFVSLVRGYAKTMDRSSAIIQAIDDCIRSNVLKDFLERNASEVRNMLFAKWDWDVAKRVWQEEAEEKGMSLAAIKKKLGYKSGKRTKR